MIQVIGEVLIRICCLVICEGCIQGLCNDKKKKDDEESIIITDDHKVCELNHLSGYINL
jgi:hypothetical protein